MRKWWIIGSGMLLASVALAAVAIVYIRSTRSDEAVSTTTPADRAPVPLNRATDTPKPGKGTANNLRVTDAGGNGQVLGSDASTGGGSSDTTAPKDSTDAEDFAVFDQYKDQTSALFQDVRKGEGLEAAANSTVTVNYRGWLTDGRLFDDSYRSGKSFSFQLGAGKVIAGWEQGLVGMKVGGKRRLVVPPAVGYGDEGRDPIPGKAVLVFDIELVEVK